jgi:hypothetical protein
MPQNDATDGGDSASDGERASGEDERIDCPETHCGISMLTRTELNAHLRWDHNRSENEAEAMLDAAGVDHAE